MDYKIIKSKRKTLALQIRGGELIVRAPLKMSDREVEKFVAEHSAWVEKHLTIARKRTENAKTIKPLTDAELDAFTDRAKIVFSERVAYYASLLGVSYGRIAVRRQKMRFGSCSSKGNLSFNLALMLAPIEVLDSVVVHELCHRKEMNHSSKFYAEIVKVFPEYKKWHAWLKENGSSIIAAVSERK